MIKVEDKSKKQEELQGQANLTMQEIFKLNLLTTETITPPIGLSSDQNEIKEITDLFTK